MNLFLALRAVLSRGGALGIPSNQHNDSTESE